MLFHAEHRRGGATVEAGAISAAVTGTDFLISNTKGRVKVICLDGTVLVYFTANPKSRVGLKTGQMVNVTAGATAMPPATTINLTTLLATSMLGPAGGLGPFPNQSTLDKNAHNQQTSLQSTSVVGKFFPSLNDLLTQPGSQPAQTITTEAAQTARNASRLPPPLPPPTPAPVAITAPVVITAAPAAGGTGGSSGASGGGTGGGTSGGGTGGGTGGAPATHTGPYAATDATPHSTSTYCDAAPHSAPPYCTAVNRLRWQAGDD